MSNDYIRQIAQDTGVSEEYLNSLWNDAEQRVDGDVEKDNPAVKLYEKVGFTNPYLEMRLYR